MNINILGLGIQGRSPNISAEKRQNLYLEIRPVGDKTRVSAHGTPGLVLFVDLGDTPCRAILGVGNFLYVVHRGTFYEVNAASVFVSRGTMDTQTGFAQLAHNGQQIMIVDGANGYIYTIGTQAFVKITDPDFPGADSLTFLDSFFIVNEPDTGRFYLSASNNGLAWDALAFATAESNPDNLTAVYSERSLLYLLGEYTTEVWTNTGALDFPFSRLQSGAVEWGLAARGTVTKFDDSLCWLARNRLGQVSAVRTRDLDIQRVSTPDLDYVWSTYGIVSDTTAYSYMLNGHPMYQINFRDPDASWLYDGKSNAWSELVSYGMTRHLGELSTSFINDIIITDNSVGRIYKSKPDVYTDNGLPFVRKIRSKTYFDNDQRQLFMSELRLDIETGVGLATGQGSVPRVMLSISRDNGHSFGVERWADIGATGEYATEVKWRRLGKGTSIVFDISISDPVEVNLIRASVDYELGRI